MVLTNTHNLCFEQKYEKYQHFLSENFNFFFGGKFLVYLYRRIFVMIQNLLCTQRTFGNYWAFAVFSGPDLIANLSDGLKIMNPGFITCDDIGKLLFVIFWKHLKQLFGHFNPLPLLLVSQQMWHPSSRNLTDFQMLLQNKVNRLIVICLPFVQYHEL